MSAIELFFENGWTDGLPIVPPTPERVIDMLASVSLPVDTVIGAIPERGRVFTLEMIAINAVLAGCLPAYFPVVVSAVHAMCQPSFGLHGPTASTHGAGLLIIVNGPIVQAIGLNAGANVFGPGHRANATIGRAIRLLLHNVGGAKEFDRATLGHPGKFSYCIAELETEWIPLHVQRGYDADVSTVTVFAAEGPNQMNNHSALQPENILRTLADRMSGLGTFNMGGQTEMAIVLCPEHYRSLHTSGWTKASVQSFLATHAVRPLADLKRGGYVEAPIFPEDETHLIRAVQSAEDLLLVVAGGEAGRFSACIPGWFGASISKSITTSIREATGST